jgi:hypothetical protein
MSGLDEQVTQSMTETSEIWAKAAKSYMEMRMKKAEFDIKELQIYQIPRNLGKGAECVRRANCGRKTKVIRL